MPAEGAAMKFGVFDHMDSSGEPLRELFEKRLRLAEAYDRVGLHALHVAEHHSTPLGMAPSPSLFLAQLAQRTRRLRFGPLVYTLPLYHPLRLAEEICTLDQLSAVASSSASAVAYRRSRSPRSGWTRSSRRPCISRPTRS
jgi:hypothetical protein